MMKLYGILTVILAICLGGCGGLNKLDAHGQAMGELVWPKVPNDVKLDHAHGTYGVMEHIALIRQGATRDQVYQLIGIPHFSEGFQVREWNYLFHFPQNDGKELSCQYKLLFDRNKRVSAVYWKAVDNVSHCPPTQTMALSADALFHFNGSEVMDLLPSGIEKLNMISREILNDNSIRSIRIEGHADRLGTEYYNQLLSQQRAESVRHYLVSKGIPANLITAEGMGNHYPVKQCNGVTRHQALIDCLQPNRRVEIHISR